MTSKQLRCGSMAVAIESAAFNAIALSQLMLQQAAGSRQLAGGIR
jgi:hypothetical protein